MTISPTLDIIIPVWNQPTETRSSLASVLEASSSARLLIVNNGCDRATELMLEEFSDHLGDRAIYMTMERNIGFVPAVNRALSRSDADWALILRSGSLVTSDCIKQLINTTSSEQAGIISPLCSPADSDLLRCIRKSGCTHLEATEISFSAVALARTLRNQIGLFDEELDGGHWCLRDYRHRANAAGYRSYLLLTAPITTKPVTVFGSSDRRRQQDAEAATCFKTRWGVQQHLAVYLPKTTLEAQLTDLFGQLTAAARNGHRIELFLHRRQYLMAQQLRACCLHRALRLHKLSTLSPFRSLTTQMLKLQVCHPELQAVCGLDGGAFPGYDDALSAEHIMHLIQPYGGCFHATVRHPSASGSSGSVSTN